MTIMSLIITNNDINNGDNHDGVSFAKMKITL